MTCSRPVLAILALVVSGLIHGCATKPIVYGPIGDKVPYGYKDRENADGGHTVLVVMPGNSAPDTVRVFWNRRAAELCPMGIARSNVFRAERKDSTYINYGGQPAAAQRVWVAYELEGYVYCGEAKPAN